MPRGLAMGAADAGGGGEIALGLAGLGSVGAGSLGSGWTVVPGIICRTVPYNTSPGTYHAYTIRLKQVCIRPSTPPSIITRRRLWRIRQRNEDLCTVYSRYT